MNIYYSFYCRAYDWYNTTGKKSKDTLRGSAIALLSALPLLNFLTIIAYISILQHHTLINKWVGLIIAVLLLIINSKVITSKKSDMLRLEYLQWNEQKKMRLNIFFYSYLLISILLLVIVLIYTAYYKHKYGNYDLG
jgi:hypothetical protein